MFLYSQNVPKLPISISIRFFYTISFQVFHFPLSTTSALNYGCQTEHKPDMAFSNLILPSFFFSISFPVAFTNACTSGYLWHFQIAIWWCQEGSWIIKTSQHHRGWKITCNLTKQTHAGKENPTQAFPNQESTFKTFLWICLKGSNSRRAAWVILSVSLSRTGKLAEGGGMSAQCGTL